MRTVLKRCDTRTVMRPPLPARRDAGGVALEQRVLGLGVEGGGGLVEHQQQRLVAHEAAGQRQLLPLPEATPRRRRARSGRAGCRARRRAAATTSSAPARSTARVHGGARRRRAARRRGRRSGGRAARSGRSPGTRRPAVAPLVGGHAAPAATPSTRMRPARRLVELAQQLHQRRLAGAVLADDRHHRAGRQRRGSRPRAPGGRCRGRRTTRARA